MEIKINSIPLTIIQPSIPSLAAFPSRVQPPDLPWYGYDWGIARSPCTREGRISHKAPGLDEIRIRCLASRLLVVDGIWNGFHEVGVVERNGFEAVHGDGWVPASFHAEEMRALSEGDDGVGVGGADATARV